MNLLSAVLLAVLAAPQVEVVSFQGEPRVGEWRGLSDGQITIALAGKDESVPLSEVLEVRFRGEPAKLDKPSARVAVGRLEARRDAVANREQAVEVHVRRARRAVAATRRGCQRAVLGSLRRRRTVVEAG